MTWLAVAVIGLGILAWVLRERLAGLVRLLEPVARAARASFGFEAINTGILRGTGTLAERLRASQTGSLNWNIFGILAGLAVVLMLVLGVR